MSENPFQPPVTTNLVEPKPAAGPRGIGGWMILPVIGLFLTPIRLVFILVTIYIPIFEQGIWEELTTPTSPNYHEMWAPLLIFEVVGNVLMMVYAIVMLVLLFRKSPLFPIGMILFYIINVLFVTADHFAANLIPAVAEDPEGQSIRDMATAAIGAAIWIPYFMVSKRVKNTFKRQEPTRPTFAQY